MQPFSSHTAVAAPLLRDDINTDQIAPVMHSRDLKEDYKVSCSPRAAARGRQRRSGFRSQQAAIPRRRNSGDRQ